MERVAPSIPDFLAMADSEPDNYTLDEMMQRLRSQAAPSAEGEKCLVTREDGTQVVKVKKRKRRSHQPHKEEELKRRKRSLVVAAMVSTVVVALALGVFGWVLYLNGSGYRDEVTARVEQWTGTETDMRSFRATPVSAAADLVSLTWPESSPVARLGLQQVRGDLMLSSHLTGTWKGERMQVGSGELVLRKSTGEQVDETGGRPDGDIPFQAPMNFSRFRVLFGDGERPTVHVGEVRGSMTIPDPAVPAANLILDGGKARIGKWGVFEIDSAALSLSSAGVRVGSLKLVSDQAPDMKVRLFGETYPDLLVHGGVSTVGMEVVAAPSAVLFGPRVGALVDGVFDTSEVDQGGKCEFDLTELESIKISGSLKTSRATALRLSKLKMLSVLSEVLDNPRYAQPRFNEATSLQFERSANEVALRNLDLESDGLLSLQGDLREVSGRLEGQLRVGIPELIASAAPVREVPLVFRESEGGYRWCSVTVSGTSSAPVDDLSDQFQAAQDGSLPRAESSGRLDDEFESLTTPDR